MPLDPTLRALMVAISRATRAFQDGDNAELKAVNESLQPLVDAAMARILAKDAEIRRLTSELAAAQAGPVVGWYATTIGKAARVGMFWMSNGPGGWTLRVMMPYSFGAGELIESGPETGDAGKAACEAAYRRACGL